MANQTRDPRTFTVLPASLDEAVFEALRDRYFPSMAHIGRKLGKRALPLNEEPPGSGNWVTSGNYSIRCNEPDAHGFFITGTGINKTKLEKEDVLFVERIDYDTGVIYAHGTARPSRETLVHDLVYQEFSGANVVLHTHDGMSLKYGTAPKTPRPIFFANRDEAEKVVTALADSGYVNIPEHGQFMVGRTIAHALEKAETRYEDALERRPFGKALRRVMYATALTVITSIFLWASQERPMKFAWRGCEKSSSCGIEQYVCTTERDEGKIPEFPIIEKTAGGKLMYTYFSACSP